MPLVERGEAPVGILAVPALEQRWVIPADRAAFEHLAARVGSASAAFFGALAAGEESAAGHLTAVAEACGVTAERARGYGPRAGCQACPAYVAWLALNASPADVVVALTANFSAWGGTCTCVKTYGAPLLCAMHATSIRSASLASSIVSSATVSSSSRCSPVSTSRSQRPPTVRNNLLTSAAAT